MKVCVEKYWDWKQANRARVAVDLGWRLEVGSNYTYICLEVKNHVKARLLFHGIALPI